MMTQEQMPLRIDGLDEYQAKILESSPVWLRQLRQRSVAQFMQLGIPTIKDEEYKYTALTELTSKKHHLPSTHKLADDAAVRAYIDEADITIVLVNGAINKDMSMLTALPKGIMVMPFMEAAAHFPQEMESTISKLTANDTRSLLALNHALFQDGVFIKIGDGAVIQPLIHIIHVTSNIEDNAVVFPRVLVHVGTQGQASILESHVGYSATPYWSNAVTDMRLGAGAHLHYCSAEGQGEQAIMTNTIRVWQEKDSNFNIFTFAHKAHLVRNNLSVLLKGEGTNTVMNGFYAVDGTQHVDNHTLLDIQQPNCTSYQLYKGILNDRSRVVFNGKIYVHSDAQKTNGYQLNKHLLLGKEARIDTKPQLEIFADDVKCTHGATIGQINEDEVFYLQSRCIPKDTAVQLLSRGFIDDIINTISNESVRRRLNQFLAAKFPEVKL